MSTITDPELDLRLGVLDPVETARVGRYATAAFLWRRVSQADALDVARGLHWRAVGRGPDATAAELVTALALHPLGDAERDRLAATLDAQCRRVPVVAQPGVDDFRRLGRRISRAVNLLDTARTIV